MIRASSLVVALWFSSLWFSWLGTAPGALGANLVTNGGFNADLTDWSEDTGSTVGWVADDHAASPSSGSAHVTGPEGQAVRIIHTCFPVTADTTYEASAWIRLTLDGTQAGRVTLLSFSSPNCSDGFLGAQDATPDAPQTGAWQFTEGQVATPATAQSALVKCEFFGSVAVDAECDAVFLPEPTRSSLWALGSLALLALVRRRAARVDA